MVDIVTWRSCIGTFVQRLRVRKFKVFTFRRDMKFVVSNVYFVLFVVSVKVYLDL